MRALSAKRGWVDPPETPPPPLDLTLHTLAKYRGLARAVLLQAVKDCTRRTTDHHGVRRYHDHGRETRVAVSARRFLTIPNAALTFWCLWLDLHPRTVMGGARAMATPVTDGDTIH
tara:strand:+ start:1111 stop:1458 length:348 start_codon:yes stop_codon:yes gene_type:complete